MSEWQPAILVNAHGFKPEDLDERAFSLFGKRVLVKKTSPSPHPPTFPCRGPETFIVKDRPTVWMCEHEVLTD